ncbi:MAG: SsrA-binding protein SmpB [Candidatus Erginobacter occultus]|nr:SsrA-binding protein SmpB [Candidatus Erginobacter occultus]
MKILVTNRKARRDYTILDTVETGIVLKGAEVKSLRAGGGSLAGSYAAVQGDEVWLHGLNINPYDPGSPYSPDPRRTRKLLLHRREIKRLTSAVAVKGQTLVPLRVYLKGGLVKVELGTGKGKKTYDKRQTIRKRETERDLARVRRERGRR